MSKCWNPIYANPKLQFLDDLQFIPFNTKNISKLVSGNKNRRDENEEENTEDVSNDKRVARQGVTPQVEDQQSDERAAEQAEANEDQQDGQQEEGGEKSTGMYRGSRLDSNL